MMKTLLCMATDHNIVNIQPLSQIDVDKVVVFITERMKPSSETLIQEIKRSVKNVETLYIEKENSLRALHEQFSKWLENNIDDEIIVNITGGTKPMSLTAYQLFSEWGFRCFYCDKDQSQLIWLDDESAISNIGSKMGLEQYLRSYRYKITNKTPLAQIPKSYKDYTNILYQELCKLGKYDDTCKLIGKIHALTQENPISITGFSQNEMALLEHLQRETGLFTYKNNAITCQDSETRKFLCGGWLEVIVADSLRANDCRDICQSVYFEISTQRKGRTTLQELDVMAMCQDKLLLVECKAKNWHGSTAEASEAIYKLGSLSNIGGLNTVAVFVSLYNLTDTAKTRAAENGIYVIAGQSDFQALKSKLNFK